MYGKYCVFVQISACLDSCYTIPPTRLTPTHLSLHKGGALRQSSTPHTIILNTGAVLAVSRIRIPPSKFTGERLWTGKNTWSLALELAREAADNGEVPVGCVIADGGGRVIGRGRNRREEGHDATAHAELEAIREACAETGDWRLEGCAIFVTLEPCPMCAGAIINSRIPTVVFGARDELTGSCGSVINLFEERYGHRPAVFGSVRAEESARLLKDFFREKR